MLLRRKEEGNDGSLSLPLNPSLFLSPLCPRHRAAELASAGQHSEKRVDGEHMNEAESQVCL